MGDLFFIIRMGLYTVIIVLIMQIKIGPQTVEQKVVNFTHKSQFSAVIQEFAQGAVAFLGVQYNNISGKVSTQFFRNHGQEQTPGSRLESKLNSFKNSIRSRVRDEKTKIENDVRNTKENMDLLGEDIEGNVEKINDSINEYEI